MPDLLLRRSRIGRAVVDVRVAEGRIVAIEPTLEPDGAEVVDADGRMLLRGLWDEHVHVTQAALASTWLPLGGAGSAAEAAALVRASLPDRPVEPVVGIGFRDGVWPDRPTRALLDEAAGERSVVLQSHDIHAVWLNSAAGRRFGVELDESGLLREDAAFAVSRAVRNLADADADAAVTALAETAARSGVVGIVDFEMAWNAASWARRSASGLDSLRIEAAIYSADLERAVAEGLRTGDPIGESGLVSVGPMKALADGALNTRTAFCTDPYPDGGHGVLTLPGEPLRRLLAAAAEARLTPAIHAIGDAAVTEVLDAFAATGTRGRIEHAQLVADADLPRFAALGVVASVQPGHLLHDREVAEQHWPGRTGRTYPFRSLLDAGATLVFGSDAPVAPLDPWLAVRAAIERTGDDRPPWHPEQRIRIDEALAAATRGRAEPQVGDVADLVLIDLPPERMHAGAVAATLVAGRFTHRPL
ncbi:amidohydrolase [Amnibacterium sp.]|uniref:amidohydrolase n=1 Tax=Amnibacterium sp. TaxID=1872496 RepID=UPI0026048F65|nr:amidohydrolase family protein [Amnibacterium sp.]MCU1472166.1 putative TIM-barrel fold metal-dependent hydrolase [Amnibacterium sp.]